MFNMIVHNDDIEVDVLCRLYILICFIVFFFSRKSMYVSNMPCGLLDGLENLDQYDWVIVHK